MPSRSNTYRSDFVVTEPDNKHMIRVALRFQDGAQVLNLSATGEITAQTWTRLKEHVDVMLAQSVRGN